MNLKSKFYDVADADEWLELAYQKRWTDGLVVAPPTERKIAAMLEYVGAAAEDVIGIIPPRNGNATMEKVAINAVMAGCLPEYMPVILAALDAMLAPEFNLNGVEATLHSCEPIVIVSGPIAKELGFNYEEGVFGGGSRANATIGRAIRLVLWNIGGSVPGGIARAILSHPGRYTYCIAENADANPWQPIHRDRGVDAENGVTVFGCDSPHSIIHLGDIAHDLATIADTISSMGSNNSHFLGETLLVTCPKFAQRLQDAGWSKKDVKGYLFEHARRSIRELSVGNYDKAHGNAKWPKWVDQTDENTLVPIVTTPDDMHIAVAGGNSVPWNTAWCPGWGINGGLAVSRAIRGGALREPDRTHHQ